MTPRVEIKIQAGLYWLKILSSFFFDTENFLGCISSFFHSPFA